MTRPTPTSRSERKLGTVFQRKQDGRWAAAVGLPDGRRVTRYVQPGTATPKRAAREQLARLIIEAASQPPNAQRAATP